MWIKWQNLATPARPLARRLPRPGLAASGGGARACGTPLSFSQLLN